MEGTLFVAGLTEEERLEIAEAEIHRLKAALTEATKALESVFSTSVRFIASDPIEKVRMALHPSAPHDGTGYIEGKTCASCGNWQLCMCGERAENGKSRNDQ